MQNYTPETVEGLSPVNGRRPAETNTWFTQKPLKKVAKTFEQISENILMP